MNFIKNSYELYELYEPKISMTHMNSKPWELDVYEPPENVDHDLGKVKIKVI